IFFFNTCLDTIRTFPAAQHDPDRAEDMDTEGEDHAVDECLIAGTQIRTIDGSKPIEAIRVGDLVLTMDGYWPVLAVFSNGIRTVFEVQFSNGESLTGTGEHPIFTENSGFVKLRELRYSDMLRPCITQTSTDGSLGKS